MRAHRLTRLGRKLAGSPAPAPQPDPTPTAEERLDLLDAQRELREVQERTGASLVCARGANMGNPAVVREVAQLVEAVVDAVGWNPGAGDDRPPRPDPR